MLLSTAYLPPVAYFQKIVSSDKVCIEKREHFVKQTYRNRCCILGANGVQQLSIPLVNAHEKTLISEKKIAYTEDWQKLHWRSIESAYRNSPYFIYYEDDLKVFYENQFDYLLEYNTGILETLLKLLKIEIEICFTESYKKPGSSPDEQDWRSSISPKILIEEKNFNPYTQVFSDKHGFKPNLSIIDLLFNQGPNSTQYL